MLEFNTKLIPTKKYPNNETIIKTLQLNKSNIIELNYESDEDLYLLYILKKYIDDSGVTADLLMKYIPYSRMDRSTTDNIFSFKYFINYINDLKFNKVLVLDPHSNSSYFLNNIYELSIDNIIEQIPDFNKYDYLFFPDNGASKKYPEKLNISKPYFFGNKKRDLSTGKITDYELINSPDLLDKNVLIIDDLCSQGFTFYNAGMKLKQNGANLVSLYVSHCENSIYSGVMLNSDYIDKIFTTNSILNDFSHNKITKLEIMYSKEWVDGLLLK